MCLLGVELDPVLIERCIESNRYTQHIQFLQADIMKTEDRCRVVNGYLENHKIKKFDLVCCFSLTMWIHLNHGDKGLRDFLDYISSIGRFLLIEPQPWKCYRSAVRRMKRSKCEPFRYFSELTWRETIDRQIMDFLEQNCGMKLCDSFGQTQWGRSISLFQKHERKQTK